MLPLSLYLFDLLSFYFVIILISTSFIGFLIIDENMDMLDVEAATLIVGPGQTYSKRYLADY